MSADDALFFEQASTSLYEKTDDPDGRCVLSLARAKAEYCTVGDAVGIKPNDKRNEDAQPEVVVQLRKRKGTLQVFLDGFLSEVKPEQRDGVEVHVHKLTWHRGLHEDVQSDTRVFSPLAIVAAVEDGQRPLQDVTVSVWTTFETQGASLLNRLLVSETRLVQHRATDARCNTVRAPYPLAYPPAPSMIIFDQLNMNRQRAVHSLENTANGIKAFVVQAYNIWQGRVQNQGTGSAMYSQDADAAREYFFIPLENLKNLVRNATSFISGNATTTATPTAGIVTDTSISTVFDSGQAIQSFTALLAFYGLTNQYDLAGYVLLATLPHIPELWSTSSLGAPGELKYQVFREVGLTALFNYVTARPVTRESESRFTIKELSRTIWSIVAMREKKGSIDPANEYRRKQSEQYRREQVVWEWLRDTKGNIPPVDDSLLAVSSTFATRLTVRIHVDDALGCAPGGQCHDIECDRDDMHTLGAVAAGTARDLVSLFEAAQAFERILDQGIKDPSSTETWYDWSKQIAIATYEMVQTSLDAMTAEKNKTHDKLDDVSRGAVDGYKQAEDETLKNSRVTDEDQKKLQEEEKETKKALEEAELERGEAQTKLETENDPVKKAALKTRLEGLVTKAKGALYAASKARMRGMWRIMKSNLKRTIVNKTQDVSNPQDETKRGVFRDIKRGIRDKLYKILFDEKGQGWVLHKAMVAAAADKRLLVPKDDRSCEYVRRLPHRGTSANTRRLFLFRADSSNGYVDLSSTYATSRAYSELHDANQMLAAAMDASAMALVRLVREWESHSSTRVKLVCMCKKIDSDAANAHSFQERVAFGTLVLTTPVDVQVAGVLANPTEHVRRQMRLVVRRAQQKCDKSLLERLGLENNDASLLASHVFGELWSEELVALHKLGAKAHQVEFLEQASRRASARLRAAGGLIMELLTVHNPASGLVDFDDVPFNATDVSLLATRQGRDAGMIVERLLFGQNYVTIRVAFAPLLRAAARATVKCADAFERSVPEHLPHEPTASLFGDPLDGVAAYVRVRRMSSLTAVVSAAAAAYPAVLLLGSDAASRQAAIDAVERRPVLEAQSEPFLTFGQLVKAMRYRLASLKMDGLPLDDTDGDLFEDTVDELANKLAVASLETSHSFYVPFGFGDSRPPPTFPPLSAPMFGSVPVFGPQLKEAFAALQSRSTPFAAMRQLRVVLMPTLGCLKPLSTQEGASDHPNVMQVSIESNAVVVRYMASRVRGAPLSMKEDYDYTHSSDVASAAKAHRRGETATRLASDVCAIAWNAERVMQAVVAALASANPSADHDGVALTLVLPRNDNEHSVWFARSTNPLASKQKRRSWERIIEYAEMTTWYLDGKHQQLARKIAESVASYTDDPYNPNEKGDTKRELDKLEARPSDAKEVYENTKKRQHILEGLTPTPKTEVKFVNAMTGTTKQAAYKAELDKLDKLRNAVEEAHTAREGLYKTHTGVGGGDGLSNNNGEGGGGNALDGEGHDSDSNNNGSGGENMDTPILTVDDINKEHDRHVYAGIACSLGVGMAMLSPLLGRAVPLHVDAIVEEDAKGKPRNWSENSKGESALELAFGTCNAMRMSEACLVVAGVISKL